MPAYITNPAVMTDHAHQNQALKEQRRNEARELDITETMHDIEEDYVEESIIESYELADWREVLRAVIGNNAPEFSRLLLANARKYLRQRAIDMLDEKPDIDDNGQQWCKECHRKIEQCYCGPYEPR